MAFASVGFRRGHNRPEACLDDPGSETEPGLTLFALRIGGLRDLEAKRKAGAVEIFRRFENETWFVDDVYEVIRLGLIGGGKVPTDAYRLAETYVAERLIVESFQSAYVILASALNGAPEDSAGKPTTEEIKSEATSA